MSDVTTNEPVLSVSFFTSAIIAVIALVTAYGVDVNAKQTAAIIGVGAILAKTLGAIYARSKVTPVSKHRRRVNQRGATSVFYALGCALLFLAIALAVLTALHVVASIGWVGIVILGAVGIFLVYWGGRGGPARVA